MKASPRAILWLCCIALHIGSVLPQAKSQIVSSVSNVEEDDGTPLKLTIPDDADGMTADEVKRAVQIISQLTHTRSDDGHSGCGRVA